MNDDAHAGRVADVRRGVVRAVKHVVAVVVLQVEHQRQTLVWTTHRADRVDVSAATAVKRVAVEILCILKQREIAMRARRLTECTAQYKVMALVSNKQRLVANVLVVANRLLQPPQHGLHAPSLLVVEVWPAELLQVARDVVPLVELAAGVGHQLLGGDD